MGEQTCPHCGQPLQPPHGITLDGATITYRGASTRLTNQEALIFTLLFKRIGHVVLKNRLYDTVCSPSREYPDPKIVDVAIYKIRRRLIPLNLRITTEWGLGYRLESPQTLSDKGTLRAAAPYTRVNGSTAQS